MAAQIRPLSQRGPPSLKNWPVRLLCRVGVIRFCIRLGFIVSLSHAEKRKDAEELKAKIRARFALLQEAKAKAAEERRQARRDACRPLPTGTLKERLAIAQAEYLQIPLWRQKKNTRPVRLLKAFKGGLDEHPKITKSGTDSVRVFLFSERVRQWGGLRCAPRLTPLFFFFSPQS